MSSEATGSPTGTVEPVEPVEPKSSYGNALELVQWLNQLNWAEPVAFDYQLGQVVQVVQVV